MFQKGITNRDTKRNTPLIVAPYTKGRIGGIGTWTKNIIDYSLSENRNHFYNVYSFENKLGNTFNNKALTRIFTGFVLYSRVILQVFVYNKKYRPSVLHIASSASISLLKDYLIIWMSYIMKIPVVIHLHFGRIPELVKLLNWEWKLLKSIIRKCRVCIVIDSNSYNALLNAGLKNVRNIPNPIGLYLEYVSVRLQQAINHRSKGRLLFVGHIIREKGVFELVNACSRVKNIDELFCIGPCEENVKKELRQLASVRDNGLWLRFVGSLPREKVLEEMQHSPILVLPSYTEGFPNVVLEAMAMGCAVIASNVGAVNEMLAIDTENPCGICVPVQDTYKLEEAILLLSNDPKMAERMGMNGNKRVLNSYTLDNVIEQYQSVWDSATNI